MLMGLSFVGEYFVFQRMLTTKGFNGFLSGVCLHELQWIISMNYLQELQNIVFENLNGFRNFKKLSPEYLCFQIVSFIFNNFVPIRVKLNSFTSSLSLVSLNIKFTRFHEKLKEMQENVFHAQTSFNFASFNL